MLYRLHDFWLHRRYSTAYVPSSRLDQSNLGRPRPISQFSITCHFRQLHGPHYSLTALVSLRHLEKWLPKLLENTAHLSILKDDMGNRLNLGHLERRFDFSLRCILFLYLYCTLNVIVQLQFRIFRQNRYTLLPIRRKPARQLVDPKSRYRPAGRAHQPHPQLR